MTTETTTVEQPPSAPVVPAATAPLLAGRTGRGPRKTRPLPVPFIIAGWDSGAA